MKTIVSYACKTLACAVAYFVGSAAGGGVAVAAGVALPAMPSGSGGSARQLALASFLASLVLGVSLGPLASRLRAGYLLRVAVLWLLTYVCLGLNTALEARLFTTVGGFAGMLVVFLPATLACAAVAAALFRPVVPVDGVAAAAAMFAAQFRASSWLWRLALGLVAFAVVYFAFGTIVGPIVMEAYRNAAFGLTLPTMGQIVPTQLLRSALFLLASLPAIVLWKGTRLRLALSLGLVHYVFVGLFGMLQAFWLPGWLRLLHGLELGADSFVYAGLLVLLLVRSAPAGTKTLETAAA